MKNKIINLIKKNWIIIFGVILVTVFVYHYAILGDYKLSFTNLVYNMSPWNTLNVNILGPLLSDPVDTLLPSLYKTFQLGSFGFWNDSIALGSPDGIGLIMYPLNYIFILPLEMAIFLRSFIIFFGAFLGMYLFMREYKLTKTASSVSGVFYSFSSTIVLWHGWAHSEVAMLAPFLFLFTEKLIKKINIKYLIMMIIVLYLMLVAGMPTFTAYFLYLLGFYVLIKTIILYKKEKNKIVIVYAMFGIVVVFGALMSMPYLSTILSSVGSNGYSESRSNLGEAILPLDYIRTILYPYIREGFGLHINESTIYFGMAGIIMLLFTIFNMKNKKNSKFWTIASLIIALLIFTHILDPIFTKLPVINTSLKVRIICLLNFSVAVVVGINLNDIIKNREYYIENFKKILFVPIAVIGILLLISKGLLSNNLEPVIKTLIIAIIMLVLIMIFILKNKKIFIVLFCFITAFDMGTFASGYLPFIDKDAAIIPQATDSIKFLQENTKSNERITAIGQWTLFPNTNVYYGLNDIRAHSFVVTNKDIVDYYKEIDDSSYTTATRVAFNSINNLNLLKYLGVKYIADTKLSGGVEYASSDDEFESIGEIYNGISVSQEFVAEKDNLSSISIKLANYGRVITSDDKLKFTIVDCSNEKILVEQDFALSQVKDNSYFLFKFDEIVNSKGNKYKIILTSTSNNNAITAWKDKGDIIEGQLLINGNIQDGDLDMITYYGDNSLAYEGKDGLFINELDEFSPQIQLIDNVIVCDTEEEILNLMKEEYKANTIFISKDSISKYSNYAKPTKIDESETIDIVEKKDDYIKVKTNIKDERFVLLNDYYNDEWKAYVDGKEVKIEKCNYLMRGVYLDTPGEHIVEFKYKPKMEYITIIVAAVSAAAFLLLIIFRRKIQKVIKKFTE